MLDDLGRAHVEALVDDGGELLLVQHAGAVGVHQNGDGVGHADGVGQLDLALAAQAGGHQVLGDVAGHVGGGAVHLGGVLAGEAAAAVGRGAAVGVHDDLASGQAGVAHGATHHKAAGGVDVELGVLGDVLGGDNGLDDLLHHGLPQLLQGDVGVVLGGHHDGGAGEHLAVVAVLHGDLALAVGAQPGELPALAHVGELAGQLVGQVDGGGHQHIRLVAGVAEHHALVAGADEIGRVGAALLVLIGLVDAHGDVGGLLVDGGHHRAGAVVEAVGRIGVADALHRAADDGGNIGVVLGGDLAHHGDNTGGGEGLAGHVGGGVVGQNVVQDGVRDLVADFVGVSLGDGLRGKQTLCHNVVPSFLTRARKTRPAGWRSAWCSSILIFRFPRRIWHLALQVAGFHRAVPSTALDKAYSIDCSYSIDFFPDMQ